MYALAVRASTAARAAARAVYCLTVTRIGFGIVGSLALSGVLVVVLVTLAGMPLGAGLGLLAALDVAIVGGGYAAMRRVASRR